MGKRGNELSQVRKEDLEAMMAKGSDAPKGPFTKASSEVLKKRRVVRATRKFGAAKGAAASSGAPPSNSIFSSVTLKTSSPQKAGGSGNPFGSINFGASSSTTLSQPKPAAFPAFAMPAAATTTTQQSVIPKPSGGDSSSKVVTKEEKEMIKCAQGFANYINSAEKPDVIDYERFVATYNKLVSEAGKALQKTPSAGTTTTTSSSTSWDTSRSLFGGSKPLVSPTAGATKSPAPSGTSGGFSFNPTKSPAPSGTSGGFSFNPSKTGTAAPAAPATFSFSTTPTPEVKAAAAQAAATTKTTESNGDENKNEGDGEEELEAADDNYEFIFKAKTKIFRFVEGKYITVAGTLKIEKHKESGKHRLIVRDPVMGRVKINTAISKGMPMSKSSKMSAKAKKPKHVVVIKSVVDTEPETLQIQTSLEDHEKLYNELQKIV